MSSEGRLGKLLPVSVAGDEKIKAAARACDHELSAIDRHINAAYILSRIEELPEPVLDLLAWQFHLEGWELARTVEEKRAFVKHALELHRYKGTPWAVRRALSALSLPAGVVEWFEYSGQPYKFKIEIGVSNREITPQLIEGSIKLIEEHKNTRSHLEEIILYYLAKGNVFISAGSMGEAKAAATQIEGYTWISQGAPSILAGSVGEVVAWAR